VLARLPAAIKAETMSAPVHAAKNPGPFKPGCFRYQTGDPPVCPFHGLPDLFLKPVTGEDASPPLFPFRRRDDRLHRFIHTTAEIPCRLKTILISAASSQHLPKGLLQIGIPE